MAIMETIKFLMFYGMEAVVVALVGVTLFAGLYQLIRDKVRQRRASTTAAGTKTIRHSTGM